MVRPLLRLRNLNLKEEEDAKPIDNGQDNLAENENGHDNLAENKNDDDLQDPPDVDGLLARLPRHHPQTPIKIICKFHVSSLHIQMQCQINLFHICRAKWRGETSFRGF